MLANFLIIGAQKSATTWLADCLIEHPDVFMARPKEIHFFNHKFDKGIAWYKAYFQDWAGQSAVGEATPGYLNHPEAPGRIKATLGDEVKLIASLRHPVDRAYSAFWHYTRRGRIPPETDFATFLHKAATGVTEDRLGLYTRGLYASQVGRYLDLLDNFMPDIRKLEDLLDRDLSIWYGDRETTSCGDEALVDAGEQAVSTRTWCVRIPRAARIPHAAGCFQRTRSPAGQTAPAREAALRPQPSME